MTTKKSNKNGNDFEKIEIDSNTELIAEIKIMNDSEGELQCKIVNANVISNNNEIRKDITHEYSTDYIENAVLKHYQDTRNQNITVMPQRVGHFTNVLRIIVHRHGYFMEVFNMNPKNPTMQKSPIGTFRQVKNSPDIQSNLSGYYAGGARFIYRDNTHPSNDVFYKDDQQE